MENFTPFASLAGGILIGLSAAVLLVFNGRIAGISGILGGLLQRDREEVPWRAVFVGALVIGGVVYAALAPQAFAVGIDRSAFAIAAAGLLVGFGTRLGNGCTSGHGVCGMSRFSRRSLVATLTFMATGAATVFTVQHVFGGAL